MSEPDVDAGFDPAPRERPQLDELGFDARLMSPERLLKLAGGHPLQHYQPTAGGGVTTVDCGTCGKPVSRLTDTAGVPYPFTALQLLQDVLRHLVMAHDVPLSGKKE